MSAPGPDQVHAEYAWRNVWSRVHVLHKREFRTCTGSGMAIEEGRSNDNANFAQTPSSYKVGAKLPTRLFHLPIGAFAG